MVKSFRAVAFVLAALTTSFEVVAQQSSQYSGPSIYVPEKVNGAKKINEQIKAEVKRLLRAECLILAAKVKVVEDEFGEAANIVKQVQSELNSISGALAGLSKQVSADFAFKARPAEESDRALAIFKRYGISPPGTYQQSLQILSDSVRRGATRLADVTLAGPAVLDRQLQLLDEISVEMAAVLLALSTLSGTSNI